MSKSSNNSHDPKVLEIGFCCSGMPELFADALETAHVRFSKHPFGYTAKNEINLTSKYQITFPLTRYVLSILDIEGRFINFLKFIKIAKKYDILHFHFNSIVPLYFDFYLYKIMRKKIILHYRGDDIRNKSYKNWFSFLADEIFVSTVDLLKYTPKRARWVPNVIDLEKYPFIGTSKHKKTVTIVHAPSNWKAKGTKIILDSISNLKAKGYCINFELIESKSQHEAVSHYMSADIVIDQINPKIGVYGNVSIENMALGKPVVCTINSEYYQYFPDLPIYKATPENLTEELELLITNPDLRSILGVRGREYVEKYHNITKAKEYLKI